MLVAAERLEERQGRCQRCGEPMTEDLEFRMAMGIRGLGIRQWRCWNGHSETVNPYDVTVKAGRVTMTCDTCGERMLGIEGQKRHDRCDAEHDRKRRRKPMRCGDCKVVLFNLTALRRHRQARHGDKSLTGRAGIGDDGAR